MNPIVFDRKIVINEKLRQDIQYEANEIISNSNEILDLLIDLIKEDMKNERI